MDSIEHSGDYPSKVLKSVIYTHGSQEGSIKSEKNINSMSEAAEEDLTPDDEGVHFMT
jgi:hypothetical protein